MANRIAMIGGGNMATALVGGLIKNGFDPVTIDVLDRNEHKRQMFAQTMGVVAQVSAKPWGLTAKTTTEASFNHSPGAS